jgi:hypothetical protein
MELPEDIREKWNLPKHVQDLYQDAIDAELAWHILEVFGYETGVLDDQDYQQLYAMFCHEQAHSDCKLNRIAACRAFVRFVKASGGASVFEMKEEWLADWEPCSEPFNCVDFETDNPD